MKENILKALTITLFLLPGLSRADTVINKYSLRDENLGTITARCPSGHFMGGVTCSSELYREPQEVTFLSSTSAKCDFELQVENEETDYDNDYNLIAPPIVIDRARLQLNCITR